jgi:hypothetical protein
LIRRGGVVRVPVEGSLSFGNTLDRRAPQSPAAVN